MTTTKLTFGSVLGTVSDTATAVSTIAKTANESISMLHDYVSNARKDQVLKNVLAQEDKAESLLMDLSREYAARKSEITKWCAEDPTRAEAYNEHYTKLKARLEKVRPSN